MRFLRLGVMGLAGSWMAAISFAQGCSPEATSAEEEDAAVDTTFVPPVKDATPDKTTITDAKPDKVVTPTDAPTDAKDGSVITGGPDAGAACTRPGEVFTRTCGLCGSQSAICEGTNTVSVYSPCAGEVVGGCMPGMSGTTACGYCGTQSRICQNDCTWAAGVCMNEVTTDPCLDGTRRYTTAGCENTPNIREQVCTSTCQYGAPTSCLDPNTISLPVGNLVGKEARAEVSMVATTVSALVNNQRFDAGLPALRCPAVLSTFSTGPSVTLKLSNPSGQTATVSVWGSQAPGGPSSMTLYFTKYAANTVVTDPVNCAGIVQSSCTTSSGCPVASSFGGLSNNTTAAVDNRVVIPPGGFVYVRAQASNATVVGKFIINTKTEAFN